jgi:quercetin dioxygenase-like cupin family protein
MTFIDVLLGKDNECPTRKMLRQSRKELDSKVLKITLEMEHDRYMLIPVGEEWKEVMDKVYIREIAPYIPHETTTIIHMNGKKGAETPLHRHNEMEMVHLLSGKVQEKSTGTIYENMGDFFTLEKNEVHGLRFLEDSILILQWIPKLT